MWFSLRARLRSLLFRAMRERDLQDEIGLHIERQTEHWIAQGMDPQEARLRARREFGAVESLKEECRDARRTALADHLRRDTRHAARRLARDWRFTLAAVLILGLGIGVNTAIFSTVNAMLVRRSLVADPDRVVEIYQNTRDGGPGINSYPAYKDIAEYTNVFADTMTVTVPGPVDYQEGGTVRTGVAEHTTSTYPTVLGLQPSLGRWFDAREDAPGAGVVAVIGHQTWLREFRADPSVVGRTIRMRGVPVTIVGVGPAGHRSTVNVGLVTDFWLPVSAVPVLGGPPRALERRPVEAGFFVKARLRDGVTVSQAQSAMDALGRRLAAEYPDEDAGRGITVMASSDVRVHPQIDVILTAIASLLLVAVGLVLAIACSNLATLLLVRGVARAKEVSVRLALGATRAQLVRHLLAESLLLALAGGAAGCVLAWWGILWLGTLELPITVDFSVDYRVVSFALALSLITGVVFGLVPALKATNLELVPALRDEGSGRPSKERWFTLKQALVVFQVVVSVVLLTATSVFLQMVLAARAKPLGYAVDGVAILETDARYAGYTTEGAVNVHEELRRRIAAIPGVQAVALTDGEPMQVNGLPLVIDAPGAQSDTAVVAGSIAAAPGYFETLQIPLLAGRAIDDRDRAGAPRVAVISERMARHHFGGLNAVGRRFRIDQNADWIEVIGVARDTGTADLGGDLVDPQPYLFYRASAQWGRPLTNLVARTTFDADTLVGAMQRELRALDPSLPVLSAKTMARHLEDSLVAPTGVAMFLGVLGALGLSLAGVGLYAVVAFAVSRRSREIGIRMALGARSREVVWPIAREVGALVAAGTVVGLALSFVLILAMRAFSQPTPGIAIYRPAFDIVTIMGIATFMVAVALAAAYFPARRAARTDPLAALRHD